MFEQEKSGYQIAQDMNLHARTVNRIIKRYQETGSYSDRQRSGRQTKKWARRTYGHCGQWNRNWVFHQDGAPSHKAEETQGLIRDNVPDFIQADISPQRNNGEWPPNSPDLNVMDYSIWSILEAEACSKPHQSIEALKKSLVKRTLSPGHH